MISLKYAQRKLIAASLPELADRMQPQVRGELKIDLDEQELHRLGDFADSAMLSAPGNDVQTFRGIIKALKQQGAYVEKPDFDNLQFQLRIELVDSDPPVWRRIEMTDMVLTDFHTVIQFAMGWGNEHMYEFQRGKMRFAERTPDRSPMPGTLPAEEYLFSEVVTRSGQEMSYLYDFGDSWQHRIVVESIQGVYDDEIVLRCLAGSGACPPEDCGGIDAYLEILEECTDPANQEDEELLLVLGLDPESDRPSDFDPTEFSIEQTDAALKRLQAVFNADTPQEDDDDLFYDDDGEEHEEEDAIDPGIVRFIVSFNASEEGREAAEFLSEDNPTILEVFLEMASSYCDATMETITVDDVQELLFSILPRKAMLGLDEAPLIVNELRLVFQFAQRTRINPQAAEIVAILNQDAVDKFASALNDPENPGLAKSLATLAAKQGFDFNNAGDVQRFIKQYNKGVLKTHDADPI